jgi:toxin-antitoxin system PIN domain toxin
MSRFARVALLDVNVLVALFDPAHVHHDTAHDWFADRRTRRWATCPLTENGFLRTAAALAKSHDPISVAELLEGLRTFTSNSHHVFWADEISLLDGRLFDTERVLGHQQLTDVYLLGLAVKRQGVLATFDQKIPIAAVKGAKREHVEILGTTQHA